MSLCPPKADIRQCSWDVRKCQKRTFATRDRYALRGQTMLYLITEALLSGVIIMAASEAAKRSPAYGALIVSLPLISILAMIWLWRDTGDNGRIAALSEGTFWLVLPTLPMFLVLPAMLRNGFAF